MLTDVHRNDGVACRSAVCVNRSAAGPAHSGSGPSGESARSGEGSGVWGTTRPLLGVLPVVPIVARQPSGLPAVQPRPVGSKSTATRSVRNGSPGCGAVGGVYTVGLHAVPFVL